MPSPLLVSGRGAQVCLAEDLREKFRPMVVVRGEKLVVFLLGNLVAVGLPVDDGGHPVLSLFRSGFHGNLAYLGSMPADLIRQRRLLP